jgi:NAD(P)-dependent dehydrogenase (short-subunit alcohol dehydrogenase family)
LITFAAHSDMKDKVVIITGGSSGIGKALAELFGMKGSKVLITGRNQQELDNVVSEFQKRNLIVHGFQADVSKEARQRGNGKGSLTPIWVNRYPYQQCGHLYAGFIF